MKVKGYVRRFNINKRLLETYSTLIPLIREMLQILKISADHIYLRSILLKYLKFIWRYQFYI